MSLDALLRATALAALFTALFVPLVVVNAFFFPFITGKAFLFRILVEIATAAYLVLTIRNPQYRPRNSYIVMSFGAFLLVMGLATLFSENPFKSFWSNFERMEGYITLLHLGAYLVVLGSLLTTEKLWKQFFTTSVAASALVGLYGVMQLFGWFVINQGGVRLDATLGNAAYLAVYMLLHIGLTLFLISKTKERGALLYFYWFALLLQLVAVYFTATRGAILGLVVGAVVTALMIGVWGKEYPRLRKISFAGLVLVALLGASVFALKDTTFIQNSPTLSRIASISLDDGATRFGIWNIALQGAQERPFFGWGQESFNYVFNKYYEPSLYAQESWFDRAHNVFLDWLIAGGILGLLGYLALYVSMCYLVIRMEEFTVPQKAVFVGLLVAYAINNFFVFDNLASYLIFFALLAYVHARTARPLEWRIPTKEEQQAVTRIALPVTAIVFVAVLYMVNVKPMLAAHDLLLALSPQQAGVATNLDYFKQAIGRNSLGNQEIREQLMQTAMQIAREETVPLEVRRAFYTDAGSEMEKQIALQENDARLYVFLGSFLRIFGNVPESIPILTKATELSPEKQTIKFELAFAYLAHGKPEEALRIAKETYESEPRFDTARIVYATILMYTGDSVTADTLLEERYGAGGIADNDMLLQAYFDAKRFDRVLGIWLLRVENNPTNARLWLSLGSAYFAAGAPAEALKALEQAVQIDPKLKTEVDAYIQEIQRL